MVKINGQDVATAGITLKAYLDHANYRSDRIAVELNGTIISRHAYETAVLTDGDTIEIVQFVGGG